MITCSAPAKIILFGEHAVVYGRPALALPVDGLRTTATVSENPSGKIWIEAPQIGLASELSALRGDHPLVAVIQGVLSALSVPVPPPFILRVESTIPVASGLGSGAAVSVAVIRALSAYLGGTLSVEQVNQLAFETEKLHHGTPSGIDNTVIAYERPVYFVKGHPIEILAVRHPFNLLIADTGISAPTKQSVADVRRLWLSDQRKLESVFDEIGQLVIMARRILEHDQPQMLGELMNHNHALLQKLTVSSPELDRLVDAARAAGAWGAKLSGGGRGGNMIALIPPHLTESVAGSLKEAGAVRVFHTTVASSDAGEQDVIRNVRHVS
ncbi:MAG: mevalonate kinase [Anaerolineae bacterium]